MNELFYSLVLPLSAAGGLAVLACLALSPLLNKLRPAARTRALAAAFPSFWCRRGRCWRCSSRQSPPRWPCPWLRWAGRWMRRPAPLKAPPRRCCPPKPRLRLPRRTRRPWCWRHCPGSGPQERWPAPCGRWAGICVSAVGCKGSPPRWEERDALWQEVCAQAGVACAPRLRACPGLAGPVMTGLVRPVLYLPEGMPLARLELALRHEAAHLSRGDLWAKALVRWCCRLHWFNPLCALQEGAGAGPVNTPVTKRPPRGWAKPTAVPTAFCCWTRPKAAPCPPARRAWAVRKRR